MHLAPTVYTEPGPPHAEDDPLVCIRLPADLADQLTLATIWLSIQLGHRVPLHLLRRTLLLSGLAQPGRALAQLQGDHGYDDHTTSDPYGQ